MIFLEQHISFHEMVNKLSNNTQDRFTNTGAEFHEILTFNH